jgi:hypothetical protein
VDFRRTGYRWPRLYCSAATGQDKMLPRIPSGGLNSEQEIARLPGAHSLPMSCIRPSWAVTSPTPRLFRTSENSTCRGLDHVRPVSPTLRLAALRGLMTSSGWRGSAARRAPLLP